MSQTDAPWPCAMMRATATAASTRILLASEGRPIPDAAIDRVVELADPAGASAHVFSIARVHGVSFGLQTPGLLPTKREWPTQREIVSEAVKRLKRKGIEADGHVLGTRKATKRIIGEAAKEGCEAIVMAADPDRNRLSATSSGRRSPSASAARRRSPCSWCPRTSAVRSTSERAHREGAGTSGSVAHRSPARPQRTRALRRATETHEGARRTTKTHDDDGVFRRFLAFGRNAGRNARRL